MITISVIGLDQFVVGELSKQLTPNLAKIYETSEDEINFVAPNNMYFHNGVDQTSWNTLLKVNAPERCALVEEEAANILVAGISEVAINIAIEFSYYHEEHRYEKLNSDYPQFLETSIHDLEVSYDDEDDDDDDEDDWEELDDEDEEIYDGDIFKERGL